MKFQTLAVTVDQVDYSLPERLNIQTDTIIGNQCSRSGKEVLFRKGHRVVYLNAEDRGVGINRNRLLENAEGDYLILADDDMRFVENYPEIAEKAVSECPDADVYIFNLLEKKPRRYVNWKMKRVGYRQFARYGAARLMLRRESLERACIRFSLEFGGGARYGSGEDTIFLKNCLDKKLKLYAVPYALAEIDQEAESTWFSGYNLQFFFDKGALYSCLYPGIWPVYAFRYLLVHRDRIKGKLSVRQAFRAMLSGGRQYTAHGVG